MVWASILLAGRSRGKSTNPPTSIRKHEGIRPEPKTALVVPLSIKKLPDQSFTRRHVGIHLDPSGSERLESPLNYLLFDSGKESRIKLLDPLELLSLGRRKSVLRVSVHQVHLSRPRPCGFLLGHREWPQPSRVDMAGSVNARCIASGTALRTSDQHSKAFPSASLLRHFLQQSLSPILNPVSFRRRSCKARCFPACPPEIRS